MKISIHKVRDKLQYVTVHVKKAAMIAMKYDRNHKKCTLLCLSAIKSANAQTWKYAADLAIIGIIQEVKKYAYPGPIDFFTPCHRFG